MCNFAPGECLAIVELDEAWQRLRDWIIPGNIEFTPLIPERTDVISESGTRLRRYGFIHVTGIPQGLEVLTVSKLSAALHDLIGDHRAVVELNLYLPLSAQVSGKRHDQFSPPALRMVDQLHSFFTKQAGRQCSRPIGLLDSGINTSAFISARSLIVRDYSGPRSKFGEELDGDHDLRGHGTAIARIFNAILPNEIPIASGRIMAGDPQGITVLRVAMAFAHLVAVSNPAVVNLSLAPRDDEVICLYCGRPTPVEAFHSLILPFVFRLTADTTLVVMAAGNRRQLSNARHALAETYNLALVEAADSSGQLANYSNRVEVRYAAAVRTFGGDEKSKQGGMAVFENAPNTFGTSFAAPFVSAAAYAYQAFVDKNVSFGAASEAGNFGEFCQQELNLKFDFRPALLDDTQRVRVSA